MIIIKRITIALASLVFYLGLAPIANAESLTPQQVERFIASMPGAIALGEKYDDGKRRDIDPVRPLTSSLELIDRQGPEYVDLAKLASSHGFSSVQQWADVGDRTTNAYTVAASGLTSSEVEAAYQKAVTNINRNSDLTDARKKAILAGMEKGHQRNMNIRKVAQQDLAAVRPHMTELDRLFE